MNKLVILIFMLSLAGCDKTPREIAQAEIYQEMKWLYDANPNIDYQLAVEKQDFRFWGLYGVGSYVPGINKECLDHEKDIQFIKGTSDAHEGYEHSKLIALAQLYAKTYNRNIKFYLMENEPDLYKEIQC